MDLKGLATQLNLSVTTVSRALNGFPEVKAATRERVIDAAREAGYVPNRLARSLQKGRTEAVGIVLPLPTGHFHDPFFAELLVGLGQRLHEADHDLMVTAAPLGVEEVAAYRRLVEGGRVDAMIVGRTRRRDERIDYLLDRGFPFVAHGRCDADRPYAHLDMDSEHGFREICARLIGLGHRRIALINGPPELNLSRLRAAGYRQALEAAGSRADPDLLACGDMTEQGGHDAATRLLATQRPTALVCANDAMAVGALRAAKHAGLSVPGDVSITGYDDLEIARFTQPALTTLRQPVRKAGDKLAEMLLSLLAGAPADSLREIWVPSLVERESDGPAAVVAAG
ncbi:MAG: substrate-binding domain-containing protein [Inquilinus sp.]|nr:substrate-binding domain-containing protein [Inquilinus sp.]